MKKQTIIKLVGVLENGSTAKTHQAADVVAFQGDKVSVIIHKDFVRLSTKKGVYDLPKSKSVINLYQGAARGIKVHFTAKKIVAKLIYWA